MLAGGVKMPFCFRLGGFIVLSVVPGFFIVSLNNKGFDFC